MIHYQKCSFSSLVHLLHSHEFPFFCSRGGASEVFCLFFGHSAEVPHFLFHFWAGNLYIKGYFLLIERLAQLLLPVATCLCTITYLILWLGALLGLVIWAV